MRIGIVGSEASKFTPETQEQARAAIRSLLNPGDIVVSGKCHLGGIDIWAVEEAKKLGLETVEYPPKYHGWPAYRERNLRIVEDSDKVVCITLSKLPDAYKGMRFEKCYHCGTDTHVKSGGCWTMKEADARGLPTQLIVI